MDSKRGTDASSARSLTLNCIKEETKIFKSSISDIYIYDGIRLTNEEGEYEVVGDAY